MGPPKRVALLLLSYLKALIIMDDSSRPVPFSPSVTDLCKCLNALGHGIPLSAETVKLCLILDSRTGWELSVKSSVQMALIDVNASGRLTDEDIDIMALIISALTPFQEKKLDSILVASLPGLQDTKIRAFHDSRMETSKETVNLKILKRSRTPRRIIFTKEVNETLEELKGVSPEEDLLIGKRDFIVQYYQQIKEYDEKIEIKLGNAVDCDEQAVMKELEATAKYAKMYSDIQIRIKAGSEGSRRANLKLPKMELPCFDGDLEGWISWWSRFKRIHEDRELDDDEKMHYLVQAMVPGSRAHRLLGAYTHTGKNYESAIGALKGRFGDKKLLIELYLRKLIDLVVLNARRQSANLDRLYDEISAYLQSLESLSIPPEYLEAGYGRDDEQDVEQGKGDRLRALMGFLRAEIKAQQRINFSRLGVGENNPNITAAKLGERKLTKCLFGGRQTREEKHSLYSLFITNLSKEEAIQVRAMGQRMICDRVPTLTAGTWMRDLDKKGVTIIKRKNVETSEIDLLLGADNLGKIWTDQVVCLEDGLTAIKTKIGWSIFGEIPLRESLASEYASPVFLTMSHKIKDLWDLEMLGVRDPVENISQREKKRDIKSHFIEKNIKRDDGHYSVSLPWREGCEDIPSNFHVAQKRLERCVNKLTTQGRLEDYSKIFTEWEQENIIERIHDDNKTVGHYLPHRPVFKETNETTPIRPVYDASCRSVGGMSLNDCLETGPNLLEHIPNVLIRFRENKIGISADIRKAFQMIEVNPEDRKYLKFIWRNIGGSVTFQHTRVVFGLTSSPFILGAVIEHHLKSVTDENFYVAQRLLRSFYVDNCLKSLNKESDIVHFKEKASEIMNRAGMELRQWETAETLNPREGKDTKVLGLLWNRKTDTLNCMINPEILPSLITRRVILSLAQKLFDPLGFYSPVMIAPKILLQKTWKSAGGWDDPLEEDISQEFKDLYEQLSHLKDSRIPRYICVGWAESLELHVFCDASKEAFATVAYMRSQMKGGVKLSFIWSKARVAPLGGMEFWPSEEPIIDETEVLKEQRKTTLVEIVIKPITHGMFKKFSEFQSNVRLLAWMTRYINKCRKASNQKGELTMEEIEYNREECRDLYSVETKLILGDFPENFKYPVLLLSSHFLSEQLIRQVHKDLGHTGVLVTLSKLREKYWILRGRKTVSRILRQCVICRRYSAKPGSVEAAPLPTNRIHLGRPFQVTGIDLFGPLLLRNNTKTWVALFTCGVYRAVHMEVIQGLDTPSFLMALRRFISRRGRPLVIYSDNGTNFAKTNKLLSHIDWDQMSNYSSAQKIIWKFNPPVSPWWGGFWERLIRIIKGIIKIMLGNKKLNFVQLETQICHIEAIVNERPLTYMSEDSDDFRPLTPALFLQVNDDSTFPEFDHICRKNLVGKYKNLQTLKGELKMRFYKEYLGELVQKKEDSDTRAITAGEVVYVGNDSQKRINWPLGLVKKVYPGEDGNCRVAKVRIKSGEIVRPIQRIYPLEIRSSDMEACGVQNLGKDSSSLGHDDK
ncbi:hypothetical protein LAZ67_9001550 [Cordylochernes scorpioides]|uniref:Integrase catalytic domain-containing protein n=1 Tax=Cordylochernes scorpioides TaxID=51811 RepID=A0ABY6KWE8_9ARAC|nr:hypothetical protein LAZ67_9001550 [Cordylochernes scorpioides]